MQESPGCWEGTVSRSVGTTVPPDAASAVAGRIAGNARVIGDAWQQGQRELTGILANPALSGGFLIPALELIRVAAGADTACVPRACGVPRLGGQPAGRRYRRRGHHAYFR